MSQWPSLIVPEDWQPRERYTSHGDLIPNQPEDDLAQKVAPSLGIDLKPDDLARKVAPSLGIDLTVKGVEVPPEGKSLTDFVKTGPMSSPKQKDADTTGKLLTAKAAKSLGIDFSEAEPQPSDMGQELQRRAMEAQGRTGNAPLGMFTPAGMPPYGSLSPEGAPASSTSHPTFEQSQALLARQDAMMMYGTGGVGAGGLAAAGGLGMLGKSGPVMAPEGKGGGGPATGIETAPEAKGAPTDPAADLARNAAPELGIPPPEAPFTASPAAPEVAQRARQGLAPPAAPGTIRYYHGTSFPDASGFTGKTFVSPQQEYARNYGSGNKNVLYTDLTVAEATQRGLYDEINGYPRNGSIDDGAARLRPLEGEGSGAPPSGPAAELARKAATELGVSLPEAPAHISYSPAVQIEGKTYTGGSHVDAIERAAKQLNTTVDEIANKHGQNDTFNNLDGFVNSDGDFVSRAEAYKQVEAPFTASPPAPEVAAALSYKGETFSGASHTDALKQLTARHPDAEAVLNSNPDAMKVGVVRNGAFTEVSRAFPEAGDVGVVPNLARTQPGAPPPPPPTGPPGVPPTLGNLPRRIFSPQSVDAPATRAGASIRKETGLAARATEQARAKLEPYHAPVNAMGDTRPLINYIETQEAYKGPPLSPKGRQIADSIRDIMRERRAKLEEMPSTEQMSFVENYYNHLWEDPRAAQQFNYNRAAKEGSGRNLKERTIPTIEEGIAAGLRPKTLNPLAATLHYVENMDRFIATNTVFDNAKAIGDVKYFSPGKQSAGWAPVNGRLGQRGGMQAYAPEGWARVYNNYVSRGIHEISPDLGHAYDVALHGSNAVSQLKLALSGYHGLTMMQESVANGLAKGIDELVHGHPIKAVVSTITAPTKPITSAIKGGRIQNIYLEKTPGTPREREIVKILTEAGGRMVNIRHAPDYQMSRLGSYVTAFRRGALKMEALADIKDMRGSPILGTARVAARHLGRIMQTIAQPIFEKYIPRIKNAAAFEHMASWMERNPNATHEETMKAARQVVDIVDDRFGEMVQDNVFMNKAVKQVAQLTFLSWSWTLGGKIRALGGGVTDMLGAPVRAVNKGFTEVLGGKYKGKDVWTPKMSYIIALPITYGFIAAIYQFLKTGEPPQDVQDLLAPRTGGRSNGKPERLLMPGYMKDVFGFYDNPLQEATNAIGPLPKLIGQTASIAGGQGGGDWRGDPILSPADRSAPWMANVPNWLRQYFGFVLQNLAPISVGNVAKRAEKGSNISGVETALGVRTAPRWLLTGEHYNPREPHSRNQAKKLVIEGRKQQERQKQFPSWMRYGGTQ